MTTEERASIDWMPNQSQVDIAACLMRQRKGKDCHPNAPCSEFHRRWGRPDDLRNASKESM